MSTREPLPGVTGHPMPLPQLRRQCGEEHCLPPLLLTPMTGSTSPLVAPGLSLQVPASKVTLDENIYNTLPSNCRAFVCKRQDNEQLGPLKMATPAPYTAVCGKTCTGSSSTAWTKSLDTGYCYYVQTTAISGTNAATYCGASPGVNYIASATRAHVKSDLENAGRFFQRSFLSS